MLAITLLATRTCFLAPLSPGRSPVPISTTSQTAHQCLAHDSRQRYFIHRLVPSSKCVTSVHACCERRGEGRAIEATCVTVPFVLLFPHIYFNVDGITYNSLE